MKLHILGAHNVASRDTRPASLVVDGVLALDAGSIASGLTFEEQRAIRAVLLSHRHFDHLRDLPLLGQATRDVGATVDVFGIADTVDAVKAHLLNDVIFSDFTRKPSPEAPKFRLRTVQTGKPFAVAGDYGVVAMPVVHSAPAVAYVVEREGRRVLYTGDCGGGLPAFGALPPVHLLVSEVNYPNRLEAKAHENGHYTPTLLSKDLAALRKRWRTLPRVLVVHMVPAYEEEIRDELTEVAANLPVDITPAHEGMMLWV